MTHPPSPPAPDPKRVLIVDDEKNLLRILAASLEGLGQNYVIETAPNGDQALEKLRRAPYQLLITDYKMPQMSGLDLIESAQQIAPQTPAVLMTAYGNSEQFRHKINALNLAGYIDKPFALKEIREIVHNAVERTDQAQKEARRAPTPDLDEAISQKLKQLRSDTGAVSVLLVTASGNPIEVEGMTQSLDVFSVAALVAANFVAAAELANLLGNRLSIFKSSYHEGSDYNIYSYDINGDFLLTVVFGLQTKPGLIWFYTKQTAEALRSLVEKIQVQGSAELDEALTVDFASQLDGALEAAFDDDLSPEPAPQPAEPPPAPPPVSTPQKPLTFEEAVAAGLVPSHLLNQK